MNFEQYQHAITRTIPILSRRDVLAMLALGTADEAGEVAGVVKKHLFQGHALDPVKMAEEIGDVLWYLTNLCTVIGLSVAQVAQGNVDKLLQRYPDGFEAERSRLRLVEDGGTIAQAIDQWNVCECGDHFFGRGNKCPMCATPPVGRQWVSQDLADEHNVEPGIIHYGTDTL